MRISKWDSRVVYAFAYQGQSVVQCGQPRISLARVIRHFVSHIHKKLMRICSCLYMN